jgi:benzylsuccinate CoA-transferase BbsF subunit
LAALNHRRRTGEGQFVDLSQVEASTAFIGEKLIETQLAGTDLTRVGNASATSSPHGIYPCADDRWLAIACADDDQWRSIWTELVDGPPPFPTRAERLAQPDEVDRLVAAATVRCDAAALMHRLQSLGVAAGAVMTGKDLLEEPHLADWYVDHDRAELGVLRHPGQAFHYRDARLPDPRRAAYLGEHNDEVLRGMLGVTEDAFAALERDAVIGWAPLGVDVPRPEVPAG